MEETEEISKELTQNTYNMQTALLIRLDTTKILDDLKVYLSGYIVEYYQDENGITKMRRIKSGHPKANDIGIQSILSTINMLINSQTVQGNFSQDEFERYIEEAHKDILNILMENMYNWGISEHDLNHIIDTIMLTVQPFISRTKNDGERKSYSTTLQIQEASHYKEGGKKFQLFGGKDKQQ